MEASTDIALDGVLPSREAVAQRLGLRRAGAGVDADGSGPLTAAGGEGGGPGDDARTAEERARHDALIDQALALARDAFSPMGLWREVSRARFSEIYRGEGENAERTPLAEIAPHADHLALFAVTLGEEVTKRIALLFAAREFAPAAVLDAVASESAERAAQALQDAYRMQLGARGELTSGTRLLRYSPGYCGWHVSGQRALFAALEPERIGIRLRASYLMEPLKSVSGVIVAGPAAAHAFASDYPFCTECRARECRDRIRLALEAPDAAAQ
jgi:hypothetical protein